MRVALLCENVEGAEKGDRVHYNEDQDAYAAPIADCQERRLSVLSLLDQAGIVPGGSVRLALG